MNAVASVVAQINGALSAVARLRSVSFRKDGAMKLSSYQARALGITPKATKAENGNKVADAAFDALCKAWGLPIPVHEYRFEPTRQWRFDWAWPDAKLALEQDGGIWTQGRHTRGSGRIKDMEKFTEAAILGWRVIYCTPKEVASGMACALVKRALEAQP